MNGLDSEEYLGLVYGMDKVLYNAISLNALREVNSVTYTNPGKIYFGEADNSLILSQRVLRVQVSIAKGRNCV